MPYCTSSHVWSPLKGILVILVAASGHNELQAIDLAYQPKLGEVRKGRQTIQGQGVFGCFPLAGDYYYQADQGHIPRMPLWFAVGYTPALAKLISPEGNCCSHPHGGGAFGQSPLPRSAGRPGRRPGPQQTVQNPSQHNPPVRV